MKKEKIIDTYVDNLRIKNLGPNDISLLEVAGFKQVLTMINSSRAVDRVSSEW